LVNSNNGNSSVVVKIDRTAVEDKLMKEKDAERVLKETAERKLETTEETLKKTQEEAEKALKAKELLEKTTSEEKKKLEEDKLAAENKLKQESEERTKLQKTIDDQKKTEFEKRKSAFTDKAKGVVSPDKMKNMEDGIQTIEQLNMAELMFAEIEENRKAFLQQEDERKKKEEEDKQKGKKPASGNIPFNPPASNTQNQGKQGYDDWAEAMNDLRIKEAKGDPDAKAKMDGLFGLYLQELKDKSRNLSSDIGPMNKDTVAIASFLNDRARAVAKYNHN